MNPPSNEKRRVGTERVEYDRFPSYGEQSLYETEKKYIRLIETYFIPNFGKFCYEKSLIDYLVTLYKHVEDYDSLLLIYNDFTPDDKERIIGRIKIFLTKYFKTHTYESGKFLKYTYQNCYNNYKNKNNNESKIDFIKFLLESFKLKDIGIHNTKNSNKKHSVLTLAINGNRHIEVIELLLNHNACPVTEQDLSLLQKSIEKHKQKSIENHKQKSSDYYHIVSKIMGLQIIEIDMIEILEKRKELKKYCLEFDIENISKLIKDGVNPFRTKTMRN